MQLTLHQIPSLHLQVFLILVVVSKARQLWRIDAPDQFQLVLDAHQWPTPGFEPIEVMAFGRHGVVIGRPKPGDRQRVALALVPRGDGQAAEELPIRLPGEYDGFTFTPGGAYLATDFFAGGLHHLANLAAPAPAAVESKIIGPAGVPYRETEAPGSHPFFDPPRPAPARPTTGS